VRAPDHRYDVSTLGDDERELGPGTERPFGCCLRVDRHEPAPLDVERPVAGADRHRTPAPALQVANDLFAALAADVDAEHVHAGLGGAPELQAARHGGA